jgi:hypothetical protein
MKAIILALVLMNVGFAKKFSTSQIVNAFANSELVTSFVEDIEYQHDVKCKTLPLSIWEASGKISYRADCGDLKIKLKATFTKDEKLIFTLRGYKVKFK